MIPHYKARSGSMRRGGHAIYGVNRTKAQPEPDSGRTTLRAGKPYAVCPECGFEVRASKTNWSDPEAGIAHHDYVFSKHSPTGTMLTSRLGTPCRGTGTRVRKHKLYVPPVKEE